MVVFFFQLKTGTTPTCPLFGCWVPLLFFETSTIVRQFKDWMMVNGSNASFYTFGFSLQGIVFLDLTAIIMFCTNFGSFR